MLVHDDEMRAFYRNAAVSYRILVLSKQTAATILHDEHCLKTFRVAFFDDGFHEMNLVQMPSPLEIKSSTPARFPTVILNSCSLDVANVPFDTSRFPFRQIVFSVQFHLHGRLTCIPFRHLGGRVFREHIIEDGEVCFDIRLIEIQQPNAEDNGQDQDQKTHFLELMSLAERKTTTMSRWMISWPTHHCFKFATPIIQVQISMVQDAGRNTKNGHILPHTKLQWRKICKNPEKMQLSNRQELQRHEIYITRGQNEKRCKNRSQSQRSRYGRGEGGEKLVAGRINFEKNLLTRVQ